jgi:predicted nuclease with TOPRIM domain
MVLFYIVKKRRIIGIGVPFLVLSIIVGIASLPDEVLLESSTNENSQILSENIQSVPTIEQVSDLVQETESEKKIEKTNAELNALKKELDKLKKEITQLKTGSEIPEEISETSETVDEELEDQPDGNVIRVSISDGVGATQR